MENMIPKIHVLCPTVEQMRNHIYRNLVNVSNIVKFLLLQNVTQMYTGSPSWVLRIFYVVYLSQRFNFTRSATVI